MRVVSVPQPTEIVAPTNEKPRTVFVDTDTVKPASSAAPPDAPVKGAS